MCPCIFVSPFAPDSCLRPCGERRHIAGPLRSSFAAEHSLIFTCAGCGHSFKQKLVVDVLVTRFVRMQTFFGDGAVIRGEGSQADVNSNYHVGVEPAGLACVKASWPAACAAQASKQASKRVCVLPVCSTGPAAAFWLSQASLPLLIAAWRVMVCSSCGVVASEHAPCDKRYSHVVWLPPSTRLAISAIHSCIFQDTTSAQRKGAC